jgi:hypothetical protein
VAIPLDDEEYDELEWDEWYSDEVGEYEED